MADARYSLTIKQVRIALGAFVVDSAFYSMARFGRLLPAARPGRHNVELIRDVPYLDDGQRDHLLDIYRPSVEQTSYPVVLYLHGGGFRILSKDTHWIMGLGFARQRFLVFNINYRLAPRHRYPAAIQDACSALRWVVQNAHQYGGDASRLVIAGESAGANLATALAVASSYRRPEPWARSVFDLGVRPVACLPACGMLQVSDPQRFARRRRIPTFIADRLEEVSDAYLGATPPDGPGGIDLADPLLVLERGEPPHRPLPPFFASVGTRDPLLDDTRRLKTALDRLGVHCVARYFPGELHAFHAIPWRRPAIECWTSMFRFLKEALSMHSATEGETLSGGQFGGDVH